MVTAEPDDTALPDDTPAAAEDGAAATDAGAVEREEGAIKLDGLSVEESKALHDGATKHEFQAEVNRMMKLIINSLCVPAPCALVRLMAARHFRAPLHVPSHLYGYVVGLCFRNVCTSFSSHGIADPSRG